MAFILPVPSYNQPVNPALALIMQLVQQASGGRAEAKQANESRYNDILSLIGGARGRSLDDLDALSGQQVADANKSYDDKRDELITDLADRGLSGSTKRIGIEAMTKRERDAAVNRINDTLLQNRSSADERFTDKATGVMERRSDPYPDTSNVGAIVSQLAGLLGQGGGLGGFGGMGANPNYNPAAGGPKYGVTQPRNIAPRNVASAPAAGAPLATMVAMANARNDQGSTASDEFKRRAGMVGLQKAINHGGLEGEQSVREALAFLQQNGWAQQDPRATTAALVDQSQQRPSYGAPIGAYYQQPGYSEYGDPRTPLWRRDPTYLGVLHQRGLYPEKKANQRMLANSNTSTGVLGSALGALTGFLGF